MKEMLKPCPFCGDKVQFAFSIESWPTGVWCMTCHMKAEWSRIKETRNSKAWDIMNQMAENWNKRAEDERKGE